MNTFQIIKGNKEWNSNGIIETDWQHYQQNRAEGQAPVFWINERPVGVTVADSCRGQSLELLEEQSPRVKDCTKFVLNFTI